MFRILSLKVFGEKRSALGKSTNFGLVFNVFINTLARAWLSLGLYIMPLWPFVIVSFTPVTLAAMVYRPQSELSINTTGDPSDDSITLSNPSKSQASLSIVGKMK